MVESWENPYRRCRRFSLIVMMQIGDWDCSRQILEIKSKWPLPLSARPRYMKRCTIK